jgi:hypothetical protein
MRLRIRAMAAAGAVVLASGCAGDVVTPPCPPTATFSASATAAGGYDVGTPPSSGFDPLFDAAASAYSVPAGLLRGIAWVETRLQMIVPDEHADHHGQPPAWGVMALRGDRLQRGAALAGVDPRDAQTLPAANIAAAAALLADEARNALSAGGTNWPRALMHFSGITLPEGQRAWAYAVLQAAAPSPAGSEAGALAVPGCEPPLPPPSLVRTVWRPSPNFNNRMPGVGGAVSMIIVHTCEGGYIGCWSWLSSTVSGVSAHYVIDEGGTEVSQLVAEEQRAWHIGAMYNCDLNRSRRCDLSGVQSNHFTVGIEHAGYASQKGFPEQQVDVSAQLVCEITRRHDVPRDFQHIVAHGQLQPWNRTDPGPNWPWVRYVGLVQSHCGEVVVDDDGAWNDPAHARATSSSPWTATHATPGFYGGGYRWAATAPDARDPLAFEFRIHTSGRYAIDARWTAGSNRTAAARFTIRTGAGALLTETMADQRTSHDRWVALADVPLDAGWHRVELHRTGEPGRVVVGDAVRVRRQP